MASSVKWLIGRGTASKAEEDTPNRKSVEFRALPSSWYRAPSLYELERRAIFSKKWLLITHKMRFSSPGDFFLFQQAGFHFILCLDREGNLNGFHNICRHRAYPVVTEAEGNAKIFSCKYHGWSYGLNGKLAKAPQFDKVADFNKEQHGLLPVHVHIDKLGFVWVNLEAAPTPTISWQEDFDQVDTQERFDRFDFTQYKFDHTWSMHGDYNWKTLADNYNECYHCTVAHPDVANMADLSLYSTISKAGHVQHFYTPKEGKEESDVKNCSTFYFPNSCMTISPHFFYLMRCVPTSASSCSMEYEVYRHINATDDEFEYVDSFFKRVLKEDKDLCEGAQRNLNAGVFVNGQLHPELESGPLYLQKLVRNLLASHQVREKQAKREIWPATPDVTGFGATGEDIAFCSGLACEEESCTALEW